MLRRSLVLVPAQASSDAVVTSITQAAELIAERTLGPASLNHRTIEPRTLAPKGTNETRSGPGFDPR